MRPTQIFEGKTYVLYEGERYFSRGATRLHRVKWEHFNGKIPKNYHVHHKDGDTHNNALKNLEIHHKTKHLSMHMTPERRAKLRKWAEVIRPLTKKWHRSEEGRLWHKVHGKNTWKGRKPITKDCAHCHKKFKTLITRESGRFCGNNCKTKGRLRRLRNLPEDSVL